MQKRTLLVGVGITAALVLGTGGGAYAAASITGANVVNGSLTGSDIKNSSLTGSDVKNGSISSSDLTTGVNGLYDNRKAKTATISHDGSVDGVGAHCPSGTILTGGGAYAANGMALWYSGPDLNADGSNFLPNSWLAISEMGVEVTFATCYSPSGAAIAGDVTTAGLRAASTDVAPLSVSKAEAKKIDQVKAMLGR